MCHLFLKRVISALPASLDVREMVFDDLEVRPQEGLRVEPR
jgi:hypothetical protein